MRFSKHTQAETFNRKEMVKALCTYLGVRSVYNGVATQSYTVGPYTVDRDGSILCEDITPLRDFLIGNGYARPEDFKAPAENTEADAEEHAAAAGTESEEPAAGTDTSFSIGMPASAMTVPALQNLLYMLYTKQYLLNRAFGQPLLCISEQLITRLQNHTPESLADFEAILKDARDRGELKGFSFEDGDVKMDFPIDERDSEVWVLYSLLLSRIIDGAMRTHRTKPELQTPENERYYMYSWLIRLGCGGPDSKALRSLMIRNLKGYCAFPDENRAQKHRDKYREIRRIRQESNEEADNR